MGASASNLGLAFDRLYKEGFIQLRDPGDAGTIYMQNKGMGICALVSAGAETRVLPDAGAFGVGTNLVVYASDADGNITITGAATGSVVLASDGDVARFIVVEVEGVRQWNYDRTSVTNGATAATTFGTDGLVLVADGTGRGVKASTVPLDSLEDAIDLLTRATVKTEPIDSWRQWDTIDTALGATPTSADDLAIVQGTFLTDSPYLTTSVLTPGNATPVVSYARKNIVVPNDYTAGAALTVRVAWARPDAAATSLALDLEVARVAAPTVDIQSTAAASINGAASGSTDFVLTPTDIVPGETLNARVNITGVDASSHYEGRITGVSLVYTPALG